MPVQRPNLIAPEASFLMVRGVTAGTRKKKTSRATVKARKQKGGKAVSVRRR